MQDIHKCIWRSHFYRRAAIQVMQQSRRLTAIIEREEDGYVALCPELDIASQGYTLEEARPI